MYRGSIGGIPVAKKNPNPIDMHVGTRVRSRRQELGLSQEKLGDALKITFQQVQKYEKGINRVSASRLQQLSHILKVPVAYFFEGTPSKLKSQANAPSLEYVSEFTATADGLSLAKAFVQIRNATVRHLIVKLVSEIAGD
jgi:transcriptional regulator with XRE-family HTH domain